MILPVIVCWILPVACSLWQPFNGRFSHGEKVIVYGSRLTSQNGKSMYFYDSPIFGRLSPAEKRINQTLGQALFGDLSVPTGLEVNAGVNKSCQFLYHPRELDNALVAELLDEVRTETRAHMTAAGLYAVSTTNQYGQSLTAPEEGFLIGPYGMFQKEMKAILNNHLNLKFGYHYDRDRRLYQVAQFFVEASSESQKPTGNGAECTIIQDGSPLVIIKGSRSTVALSYEVNWIPTKHLPGRGPRARGYSLRLHVVLFSLAINLLLSGLLVVLIRSSFSRPLFMHSKIAEVEDESGWKLIHGDVFRTPARSELLVVLVGAGLHVGAAILLALCYQAASRAPPSPGRTVNAAIVAYVICGFIPAFIVGAIYRSFSKGRFWRASLYVSQLYPWIFTALMVSANATVLFKHPSFYVASYKSLMRLNLISLTCALPAAFVGFYYGYRKNPFRPPIAANKIPRQIPFQPRFLNFVYCSLLYGLVPFNTIFFELRLVYDAFWRDRIVDYMACSAATFLMFLTVSSSMSMLVTYLLLQNEDYRWWWKSFAVSSGVAFYIFLYSIYYAVSSLTFPGIGGLIVYVTNSMLICCTAMVLSGSFGFIGSFFFVRHVYGYLKVN